MEDLNYWMNTEVIEKPTRKLVSTPTVLVVDDDPAFRELLSEFLWDTGYRLREAADGLEALEVLDLEVARDAVSTEVDLVIVDLLMPRMSGLEFVAKVRSWSLTLPVITMSAFPDAKFYRNSYEMGCVAAFAKPFSFFEFLDYVDSLFDR